MNIRLKSCDIKTFVLVVFFLHLIWKVGFSYSLIDTVSISKQGIDYVMNNMSTVDNDKMVLILRKATHISSTIAQNFFTSTLVTLLIFTLYVFLLVRDQRKKSISTEISQ